MGPWDEEGGAGWCWKKTRGDRNKRATGRVDLGDTSNVTTDTPQSLEESLSGGFCPNKDLGCHLDFFFRYFHQETSIQHRVYTRVTDRYCKQEPRYVLYICDMTIASLQTKQSDHDRDEQDH